VDPIRKVLSQGIDIHIVGRDEREGMGGLMFDMALEEVVLPIFFGIEVQRDHGDPMQQHLVMEGRPIDNHRQILLNSSFLGLKGHRRDVVEQGAPNRVRDGLVQAILGRARQDEL